jgi:hypothetical protein
MAVRTKSGVLALTLVLITGEVPMRTTPETGVITGKASSFQIAAFETSGALVDQDHNGIPDDLELQLANEFAPILFYEASEPNLPSSAQRYLQNSELWFFSRNCSPQQVPVATLSSSSIPRRVLPDCRAPQRTIDSHGTRSSGKESTFYLRTVPETERRGSTDTQQWITYVHAFRNDIGGITLQFWRFYPYNTGYFLGFKSDNGSHSGDWEAIHVVLQSGQRFIPVKIRLLGHTDLITKPWSDVIAENGHALIKCGKGGHTSMLMSRGDLVARSHFIEQESWTGGTVRWPGRGPGKTGPLIRLGQKAYPAPGMEWLRYSGLWGTRESSGMFSFYRSGYWGPAFNETGMGKDGFVSAWCEGMARPKKEPTAQTFTSECYPASVSP